MTGLVRKTTLLSAGALLIAGAAMAGIPSAANSVIPSCITVSDGSLSGACNSMTIRDAANNPVANVTVVLDFTTCSPDGSVEECSAQPNPIVGTAGVVTGPGETITYTADGSGNLCVTVIGSGTNITPSAAGRPVCAKIIAASVLMGTVTVTVVKYDQDSSGGVGGLDGALWVTDFLANPTYNSRSDYDCSGGVGGLDGALWVSAFLLPMTATELSTCPGLLP